MERTPLKRRALLSAALLAGSLHAGVLAESADDGRLLAQSGAYSYRAEAPAFSQSALQRRIDAVVEPVLRDLNVPGYALTVILRAR